jgi:hypothetical protein
MDLTKYIIEHDIYKLQNITKYIEEHHMYTTRTSRVSRKREQKIKLLE